MKNKNIIHAFSFSVAGLKVLLHEKVAKREIFLLIFSIFFILVIKLENIFILLLLILPLLILSMEALNTAIEYTCNQIITKKSSKIRKAKDLGSAAIFLSFFNYLWFCIFFKPVSNVF
jgi:diacylglycerol kinase (ATP)